LPVARLLGLRSVAGRFTILVVGLLVPSFFIGTTVALLTKRSIDTHALELLRAREVRGLASRSYELVLAQDAATKTMLLDPAQIATEAEARLTAFDSNAVALARLDSLARSQEMHAIVVSLRQLDSTRMQPIATALLEQLAEGKTDESRAMYFARYAPSAREYSGHVQRLAEIADARAREADAAMVRSSSVAFFVTAGALLLSTLLISLVVYLRARRIGRLLRALAQRAEEVRTGGLDRIAESADALSRGQIDAQPPLALARLEIDSSDEMGALATSLNGIIERTLSTAASFDASRQVIQQLVAETEGLTRAARAGTLQVRAETTRFQGGYADLLTGINAAIDGLVAPANEASSVLTRVAARDLTARMTGEYAGDHARLRDALNSALTQLGDALTEVTTVADDVAIGAERIGSASEGVATRAREEASTLDDLSTLLKTTSASMRDQSQGANETSRAAGVVRDSADAGQRGMTDLASAMREAADATRATAKIVKTIDEIAFQTNLLALNAAVEAARAGDAGKGFAVVADEVRNLALRAADAARNTSELIERSGASVLSGATASSSIAEKLVELNTQIAHIAAVLADVSSTSADQARGVEGVSAALGGVLERTRETSSSAAASAEGAGELATSAARLRDLVRGFKLRETTEGPPARPAVKRAMKLAVAGD
jgi:methyl-accepting chemotaxis protein